MHSALSALDSMDTQHSVPLTLQALSAKCEHRVWSLLRRPSVMHTGGRRCSGSAALNCAAPGPARPSRRTLRLAAEGPGPDWNYCSGPESWKAGFTRSRNLCSPSSSRRDGAGTRVQRRQGVEPGAPTARSVETAVTRVSKQQRRGRAGGFDDDVRRDAQICRGGQAVSWTAAG